MHFFGPGPRPVHTIWGSVADGDQIIPGCWSVSTASHGGLILSDQRCQAMPASLRLDENAYEEDADWSLAFVAFEAELKRTEIIGIAATLRLAHDIARNWHPDRYGLFTGAEILARDSHVMRSRQAYSALIGQVVVVSAFGTWAEWVPAGRTGVIGRRLESVDYLGQPIFAGPDVKALVDQVRYDSTRIVNGFADIGAEVIPS